MKKLMLVIGLCAGLLLLGACASVQGGGDLTGQVWVLSELSGNSPVSGTTITALFTKDGKVGGSSGCNSYSGEYTTSGSSITFKAPMAMTMMACPDDVMTQETAYMKALEAAKKFSVKGDQLTLSDGDNKALAIYKAQSQELSGTSWEVTSYNNGKQAVKSVLVDTTMTANFGEDGTLSGNSGCNEYNGPYKVDGDKIDLGPFASTRMACDQPVMDQETQYLAALETAAKYQIMGNVMEMRTADGALAASFNKK